MCPARRRTPFKGNRQITDYLYADSRVPGPEVMTVVDVPRMFEVARRNGYTDVRCKWLSAPGSRSLRDMEIARTPQTLQVIYSCDWKYDPLPAEMKGAIFSLYGSDVPSMGSPGFFPVMSNMIISLTEDPGPPAAARALSPRPVAQLMEPTPWPTRRPTSTPSPTPTLEPTPTPQPTPDPTPGPPRPDVPPGSWIYSVLHVSPNGHAEKLYQAWELTTSLPSERIISTTIRQLRGNPSAQTYALETSITRADDEAPLAVYRTMSDPCAAVLCIISWVEDWIIANPSIRVLALHE